MKELQQEVLQSVFGKEIPTDPELEFYRGLSWHTLKETISDIFSTTQEVYEGLGREKTWDQISEEYISENWPKDIRLGWSVANFADWWNEETWLKELADLEWVWFLAMDSRDPMPGEWLNPSLSLRVYEYPVGENYPLISPSVQNPSTQYLAVFRDPKTMDVKILALEPAAFEILQKWKEGEKPEVTAQFFAQATGRPVERIREQILPLLMMLVNEGVVLQSEI